jgi:hypothetical protein
MSAAGPSSVDQEKLQELAELQEQVMMQSDANARVRQRPIARMHMLLSAGAAWVVRRPSADAWFNAPWSHSLHSKSVSLRRGSGSSPSPSRSSKTCRTTRSCTRASADRKRATGGGGRFADHSVWAAAVPAPANGMPSPVGCGVMHARTVGRHHASAMVARAGTSCPPRRPSSRI